MSGAFVVVGLVIFSARWPLCKSQCPCPTSTNIGASSSNRVVGRPIENLYHVNTDMLEFHFRWNLDVEEAEGDSHIRVWGAIQIHRSF